MAKKKKSKGLLPKKIAGIKVPKAVRKGRFGELLASPAGQKLIIEALAVAGAMAGAKKAKDSPKVRNLASDAAGKVSDKVKAAGDGAQQGASTLNVGLALALGEAARAFTDALKSHSGRSEPAPSAEPDWSPAPTLNGSGEDASKKNSSSPYEAGPL